MARRKKEPKSVHREKIASAASALFMERGIAATSMDDITKAAGYSKATLYVYFENKEEIIGILVLNSMKKLYHYIASALEQKETTKEQYNFICQGLVQYQEEFPFYFKMVLFIIMLLLLVGFVWGILCLKSVADYKKAVKETTFEDINISDIPDGVYVGEYDVNFIYAKVEVTVQNGEITNINILEHRHERGKAAEVIADCIVDEQKIDVDAISGATNSSTVIKKSIENALARVAAHLRRDERSKCTPKSVSSQGLIINLAERTIFYGEKPLNLSNRKFDIVEFLIRNANQI